MAIQAPLCQPLAQRRDELQAHAISSTTARCRCASIAHRTERAADSAAQVSSRKARHCGGCCSRRPRLPVFSQIGLGCPAACPGSAGRFRYDAARAPERSAAGQASQRWAISSSHGWGGGGGRHRPPAWQGPGFAVIEAQLTCAPLQQTRAFVPARGAQWEIWGRGAGDDTQIVRRKAQQLIKHDRTEGACHRFQLVQEQHPLPGSRGLTCNMCQIGKARDTAGAAAAACSLCRPADGSTRCKGPHRMGQRQPVAKVAGALLNGCSKRRLISNRFPPASRGARHPGNPPFRRLFSAFQQLAAQHMSVAKPGTVASFRAA